MTRSIESQLETLAKASDPAHDPIDIDELQARRVPHTERRPERTAAGAAAAVLLVVLVATAIWATASSNTNTPADPAATTDTPPTSALDSAPASDGVTSQPTAPNSVVDLAGSTWLLDGVSDPSSAIDPVPPGTDLRLTFGPDGTYALESTCDGGTGTYVADGGTITLGPLTRSRLACDKTITPGDQIALAFTAALSTERSVSLDGQRLTVAAEADYVFTKI